MRTTRVAVVSGSYGAGHDAAADAIAADLRAAGHDVSRLDVVEELPWRVGVVLRWLYFTQLRLLPGSWGTTLRCLEHHGVAIRLLRRLLGLAGRRLVRRVADADLVISTHPFASQALGEARAEGRLAVPAVTYLTDASVHRLWVHPAIDLHLAIHTVAEVQARALGGRTRVVSPVVRRAPAAAASSQTAPWPLDRPAALIVGGSCGVGDLEASARDVLAGAVMTPVVACGRNERLRHHLATIPGVVALGWRDDLPQLVEAATCVLQNAGGMTSLESLAAGTPTLTYRPIPGHGTTNAEALCAAGLVPWVRDAEDLARALAALAHGGPHADRLPHDAPSVAAALAGAGLLAEVVVPVAA